MPEKNITYEIQEHFGVLNSYDNGWNKELNLVCWNGGTAKFDIREWDEHHERMSKGITLTQREMRKLVDLYVARNNDIAVARGRAIEAERNARREAAMKKREEAEALRESAEAQDVQEPPEEKEPEVQEEQEDQEKQEEQDEAPF